MKWWAFLIGFVVIGSLVYFVGFDMLDLYSENFSYILIIVSCIVLFVGSRVNWKILFRQEREIFSCKEWLPLAVAALKKNSPELLDSNIHFEGEIIPSVPIGIIYAFNPGIGNKKCAFGEVWKDSKNFVISPLESIEWHLRTNFCKSKQEVGFVYLRVVDREPLSIWRNEKKSSKEVFS